MAAVGNPYMADYCPLTLTSIAENCNLGKKKLQLRLIFDQKAV